MILKPHEQKLIEVKVQFIDEISGLTRGTHSTLLINLKFTQNKAI